MTDLAIDFGVAIVDPRGSWAPAVEDRLRQDAPDRLVRFYETADDLLVLQHEQPHHVPLVVIADLAAVTPSIAEGVFVKTHSIIPRCAMVYYSAEPRSEDAVQLLQLGYVRMIPRQGADPLSRLCTHVDSVFQEFSLTPEHRLLMEFQDDLPYTPNADRSGIDGDEDNELAPARMLLEMARGTPLGRRYLWLISGATHRATSPAEDEAHDHA